VSRWNEWKNASTNFQAGPQTYPRLEGEDLVVAVEGAVEGDLEVQVDPELVPVLQVELDLPLDDEEVDLDTNTVLQVPVEVSETDADDADADANLEAVGVDIPSDLERSASEWRSPSLPRPLPQLTLTGPNDQSIDLRPAISPGGRLRAICVCSAT
jgi:hypothetical protein